MRRWREKELVGAERSLPAEEVGGGLLYGGRRPEDGSTRGDGDESTREEGIRGRKVGPCKLLRIRFCGMISGGVNLEICELPAGLWGLGTRSATRIDRLPRLVGRTSDLRR